MMRAETEMLAEVGDLMNKPGLRFQDIPTDLLIRRLLFCGFAETGAQAQSSIRILLTLMGVAEGGARPEEEENSEVTDLLKKATGGEG